MNTLSTSTVSQDKLTIFKREHGAFYFIESIKNVGILLMKYSELSPNELAFYVRSPNDGTWSFIGSVDY